MQTGETAASIAAQGVATTATILSSLSIASTVAAGGVAAEATVLGISAAVVPVIGAAIAGIVAVGIAVANMFKGCGQTCIAATNIANQVGDELAKNVDHYTSSPIRFASMQAAALNVFDTAWAALVQACNNPQLQAAGQRCITDRQRGACVWKASPGGWNPDGTYTMWGPAGSGTSCWNWFTGMRDPIANDPFVQPDPTPAPAGATGSIVLPGSTGSTQTDGGLATTLSTIPTPLLIGGAILLALLASGEL